MGDGEDCDADTGNWFVVSSTLPSSHWGHLQRDQPPDVAQISQTGDSFHLLKIRPPMIFCSNNQAIIQTTKHGLFTLVSCRNVPTPAGSPVSGTGLVVALSGSPLIRIRGWGRIFTTV